MVKMLGTLLVFALSLTGTRTLAGIAESPLPVLQAGATTVYLYSVPGVMRTDLGTFFSCTSTDTATMQVGVEVFGPAGGGAINDPVATSLSVGPGATVIFGTGGAADISIDSNLGVGFVSKGSARVLATSKKLVCTAFVADSFNAPPTTSWQLNILAKLKQKGD